MNRFQSAFLRVLSTTTLGVNLAKHSPHLASFWPDECKSTNGSRTRHREDSLELGIRLDDPALVKTHSGDFRKEWKIDDCHWESALDETRETFSCTQFERTVEETSRRGPEIR